MSHGEKLARNAAWLVLATALNKVLAFAAFYVVARLTGPTTTGVYFYGVSVTSVFVILSDVGMTPVLIRAIAGGREDAPRTLDAVMRLKLFLAPIAILCAVGYGIVNGVDATTLATIAIACAVMTADTFHLALYGTLRGKQNLRVEALGMLVGQILTTGGSISAALLQWGPPGLAGALFLGSAWNVLWSAWHVRLFKIASEHAERADYRRLLKEAVPFGISGIAVKVYSYVDSLLIHAFHGATAVGEYAVAYKMTYALQFLPMTFSAALYPALAESWSREDHEAIRRSFVGSMRFLAAVGCVLTAGLSALAPRLVDTFYGARFLGSVVPLEILPWVLLPIFMDFPIGALLNASHRAHLKTTAMVGTMLVNVVLNVIFVPLQGPTGAAWSGVCSFWFLFCIGAYFASRDAGGWRVIASLVGRSTIAAIVTWLAIRIIGRAFSLVPAIIFGGAVACMVLSAFQLITREDVRFVSRLRKRTVVADEDVHAES